MKQFHIGRLIDHVHLRARDLEATKRFYKAVLGALGIPVGSESPKHVSFDELWIDALGDDKPSASHVHLASRPRITMSWRASMRRGLPPAAATTALRANASTTPATTRRSCSIRTATMWKRSTMDPGSGPRSQ